MHRTQIYLDDRVRRRVERVTARDGRSMSEVIRGALDCYLDDEERLRAPLTEVAGPAIGAWANRGDAPVKEQRKLRLELERRAKELGY